MILHCKKKKKNYSQTKNKGSHFFLKFAGHTCHGMACFSMTVYLAPSTDWVSVARSIHKAGRPWSTGVKIPVWAKANLQVGP